MNLEVLRILRNILLRSFLIGLIFALLMALIMMISWDAMISFVVRWFHTDEPTLSRLVLVLFTGIRFWLVFVLLTPGLAIHWTLKREQSKSSA